MTIDADFETVSVFLTRRMAIAEHDALDRIEATMTEMGRQIDELADALRTIYELANGKVEG